MENCEGIKYGCKSISLDRIIQIFAGNFNGVECIWQIFHSQHTSGRTWNTLNFLNLCGTSSIFLQLLKEIEISKSYILSFFSFRAYPLRRLVIMLFSGWTKFFNHDICRQPGPLVAYTLPYRIFWLCFTLIYFQFHFSNKGHFMNKLTRMVYLTLLSYS